MRKFLDFDLDGFDPTDLASEYAEQRLWAPDFVSLAEHHDADRSTSYLVAHDESATWGNPGTPQILAIKVSRDFERNTFTIQSAEHAIIPFAQNWLAEQGCPPEAIAQADQDLMEPADDLTARIERKVRTSGTRYDVLDSHSSDFDPCEIWTLTRDAQAEAAPVRLFLEEGNFDTHTYTLREGAFEDESAARSWLDDRSTPLPQPAEHHGESPGRRAQAALARSAGATAATHPVRRDDVDRAPAAAAAPQSSPRRSM